MLANKAISDESSNSPLELDDERTYEFLSKIIENRKDSINEKLLNLCLNIQQDSESKITKQTEIDFISNTSSI